MTMLTQSPLAPVLEREHALARQQGRARRAAREAAGADAPPLPHTMDFRISDIHRASYLSISRAQGRFLYAAARSIGARHIVEFGSSFGISTLYLAAVAASTGGKVISSEFHGDKIVKANENLQEAGLAAFAEIRQGEAEHTLAAVDADIDFLFLDGAKGLYLDILLMLEPKLRPGAVVVADNVDTFEDRETGFIGHIRSAEKGYVTSFLDFIHGAQFSYSLYVGSAGKDASDD